MEIRRTQNNMNINFKQTLRVQVLSMVPERPGEFITAKKQENVAKAIDLLIGVLEKHTGRKGIPRPDIIELFAKMVSDYKEPICNAEGQTLIRHSSIHYPDPYIFTGEQAVKLRDRGKSKGMSLGACKETRAKRMGREYRQIVLKFIEDKLELVKKGKDKDIVLNIYTLSASPTSGKYNQTLLGIDFRDPKRPPATVKEIEQALLDKGIKIPNLTPKGQLSLFFA